MASRYNCDAVIRDAKNEIIGNTTGQFSIEGDGCLLGFELPPFNTALCCRETEHLFTMTVYHSELGQEGSATGPFDVNFLSAELKVPSTMGAASAEFSCARHF